MTLMLICYLQPLLRLSVVFLSACYYMALHWVKKMVILRYVILLYTYFRFVLRANANGIVGWKFEYTLAF